MVNSRRASKGKKIKWICLKNTDTETYLKYGRSMSKNIWTKDVQE